jgi:hypothetical protein
MSTATFTWFILTDFLSPSQDNAHCKAAFGITVRRDGFNVEFPDECKEEEAKYAKIAAENGW